MMVTMLKKEETVEEGQGKEEANFPKLLECNSREGMKRLLLQVRRSVMQVVRLSGLSVIWLSGCVLRDIYYCCGQPPPFILSASGPLVF